jgi:hypothetical protein
MTTNNITLEQLRDMLGGLHDRMDRMTEEFEELKSAVSGIHTATQSARIEFTTMQAESLIKSFNDKGEPVYKVKGEPYSKFGVRLWPEVLEKLPIDAEKLEPGPNKIDLPLRVLMGTHKDSETGEIKPSPKKIVGLA